jgi:hypothetical protein
MPREGWMPVLRGAIGCAAALVLLAGHGAAQQNATFNSYQVTTFIPAPFTEGQAADTRQWGEAVAVDDDGNIYLGMNGNKGVERYAIR